MPSVDDLIIRFMSDTRHFKRGTHEVRKELSWLSQSVRRRAAPQMSALTKKVLKLGAGLAGVGSIVASVKLGTRLASEAETAQIAFTTLIGSTEDATKVLKQLNKFAATTPFRQDEVRNAGKQLIIAGESTETLTDRLRRLGDISALTGNRIEEVALLYGRARNDQILYTEAINQFQDRGIPVYQELAKQLNTNVLGVKKLAAAGEISFDKLEKAIISLTGSQGKFGGGSAALADSLAGKWSTLTDTFGNLAKVMGEKLVPILKGLIDQIQRGVELLKNVQPERAERARRLSTSVNPITGAVDIVARSLIRGRREIQRGAGVTEASRIASQLDARLEASNLRFPGMQDARSGEFMPPVIRRFMGGMALDIGQSVRNRLERRRRPGADERAEAKRGFQIGRGIARAMGDAGRGFGRGALGAATTVGGALAIGGSEALLRTAGTLGANTAVLKGSAAAARLENRRKVGGDIQQRQLAQQKKIEAAVNKTKEAVNNMARNLGLFEL